MSYSARCENFKIKRRDNARKMLTIAFIVKQIGFLANFYLSLEKTFVNSEGALVPMKTYKLRIVSVPLSTEIVISCWLFALFARQQVHEEVPADARSRIHYARPAVAYNRKILTCYSIDPQRFADVHRSRRLAPFWKVIPCGRARSHLITRPVPPLRWISFITLLQAGHTCVPTSTRIISA